MAKILIWPDMYKERGHWMPTFAMAKALEERSHTVQYMGIKDCETIATDYGFTFHPIFESLYPPGYSFENDLEPKAQRWKPHHLLPITRGEGGLEALFTGPNRPDIIVSGYFTALETLLLHYKYEDIPFVITTTYLRHPDENPYIRALTQLVHMPRAMSTKIMDAVKTPEPGKENDIREFVAPLADHQEIIACPQVFDFDYYQHDEKVTYVEPMITPVPDSGSTLPTLPTDKKIIFATAGSMVEDYLFKAKEFFTKMIQMMSTTGMDQWHLVLSVGPQLIGDFKNVTKSNVTVCQWVSQVEVLEKASVVFTHGGLATLKEAIFYNVPIVVVPHGKDQMDNALRVKQHKVGVLSELNGITVEKLKLLMTEVTTSPWISKKIEKMQEIFNEEETNTDPRPSVEVIETALGIPPVV